MSEDKDNKVNLEVPEHLEYSDEHVWVDTSVEPAMVGITEYATDQLGELVYVDLPEVGTQVQAGDEVAELESAKAVSTLIAPVAGTIRYVNSSRSNLRMTSRICCPPKSIPRWSKSWPNKGFFARISFACRPVRGRRRRHAP